MRSCGVLSVKPCLLGTFIIKNCAVLSVFSFDTWNYNCVINKMKYLIPTLDKEFSACWLKVFITDQISIHIIKQYQICSFLSWIILLNIDVGIIKIIRVFSESLWVLNMFKVNIFTLLIKNWYFDSNESLSHKNILLIWGWSIFRLGNGFVYLDPELPTATIP